MKKIYLVLLMALLVGCATAEEKISSYFDDPRNLIRDPHYAAHQEQLSGLERQYLNKEISFADYQTKKKDVEETYALEVQQRDAIITSPNSNIPE